MLTPFDHFMRSLTTWLDTAWYIWVVLAVVVIAAVGLAFATRARARSRRRVPQYRRQLPD